MNDNFRKGRPKIDNNDEKIKQFLLEDPLLSTRDISEQLNVHKTTVSNRLKEIGFRKVALKWVPHELTKNLKEFKNQKNISK